MRTKKTYIEDPTRVKVVHPSLHSTICNPEPKTFFVLDTPIPQPKPVDSPDTCPSPDDAPQDMDQSHLSDSTSTTTNLIETCSLDTSCDHLLHLDSPSLLSEQQDIPSVESLEIEFVPDIEEPLKSNKLSPTDVFSVQHDYDLFLIKRLILHLTVSTIRTLMSVKSNVKMTSSIMPLTLATVYPIHGTTQL